jgi:uncharacterized protein
VRLVLDTNIVLSGLLWSGTPKRLMQIARSGSARIMTSQSLLAELRVVITRGKFTRRLQLLETTADSVFNSFMAISELVASTTLIKGVSRDPKDDHVLAAALSASADAIVSGDQDLLCLESFEGIPILTAAQTIDRINQ